MIWFFVIASAVIALVGATFLVAPRKMLFLMSDAEKQRLMEGGSYRVTARVGGVLMVFICAPLNLVVGFLVIAWLAAQ